MKWNKFHLDTAKNLPLYQLLADQLRQWILTGVLAPGEKLPGSRELQKLLHLSAVTIENGLNILTKEQFLLRRPRCGTFVAETLPGMATGMLEPPGCIYAVLSNLKGLVGSYWWIIVSGLEQQLRKAGYRLCIHQHEADSPLPEELLHYKDCIGLLLCGYNSRRLAEKAKASNIPVVLIGGLDEEDSGDVDFDMVMHNDRERAMISMAHLLDLGHRRIAVVTAPPYSQFAARQKQGVMDAVATYGLTGETITFFQPEGLEYEDGVAVGYEIFCRRNRPTAVYAGNDFLAYGIIAAAEKLGLSTGKDFSIIGCGGINVCGIPLKPVLTTTVSKPEESVRIAVEKLLRQIHGSVGEGTPVMVRVTSVSIGETTRVYRGYMPLEPALTLSNCLVSRP